MNTNTQETHSDAELVDAAYLMQGYRSKHGSKLCVSLTAHPNSSEVDIVTALVAWSPRLNAISNALAEANIYPGGVFCYEVTEELGVSIGDMVHATRQWPDDTAIWGAVWTHMKACYIFDTLDPDEKQAFTAILIEASGINPLGLPYTRKRQAST